MSGQYTKMETIKEEVFRRKQNRKTNREIAESYGLTKKQIKQSVTRENRKEHVIQNGYIPRPKGRSRKKAEIEKSCARTTRYACGCRWKYCKNSSPFPQIPSRKLE